MRALLRTRFCRAVSTLAAVTLFVTAAFSSVGVAFAAGSPVAPDAPITAEIAKSKAAIESPPATRESSPTIVGEIVERRTAISRHMRLSDGSVRAEIYGAPIHYKDSSDKWVPIDRTVVASGLDEFENTRSQVRTTFRSGIAADGSVGLQGRDWSLSISAPGMRRAIKLAHDDTLSYVGAAPDTSYQYRMLGDGLKETIVLHSPSAAATVSMDVALEGVGLVRGFDGIWYFSKPGASAPEAALGGFAVFDSSKDAHGDPAPCAQAAMQVEPNATGARLTYTVPRAWLDDPARVYPVMIDPTYNWGAYGSDSWTYGNSAYHDVCYNSETYLRTGWYVWNGVGGQCRAYMKFDVSSLASKFVRAANLRTYVAFAESGYSQLWRMDAEGVGKTWHTQPAVDGGACIGAQMLPLQGQVDWPVTSTVRSWAGGALPATANHGFRLNIAEELHYTQRYSSVRAGEANRPRLEVEYLDPATAVTAVGENTTGLVVADGAHEVTATVRVLSTAASDIRHVTMLGNQAQTPANQRGAITWTAADPGATPFKRDLGSGKGWVSFNPADACNTRLITPVLDRCDAVAASGAGGVGYDLTFVYRPNADFGYPTGNTVSFQVGYDDDENPPEWNSPWLVRGPAFDVVPGATGVTAQVTGLTWHDETLGGADSGTTGRGVAALAWDSAPMCTTGYSVYLSDGNAWREVATMTAPAWSSSGKGLYPSDSQIAAIASAEANPYLASTGLDLRDDPTPLYAKTAGTGLDSSAGYAFKVAARGAAGLTPLSACPTITVQLPNRTLRADRVPLHTEVPFDPAVGHALGSWVESGTAVASITDLSIRSCGPPAGVSRTYRSDVTTSSRFAPGWRFDFESAIETLTATSAWVSRIDESGEHVRFHGVGPNRWVGPASVVATLTSDTARTSWTLVSKGTTRTFDALGRLTSVSTRDVQAPVTYVWSDPGLHITASNGHEIIVTFDAAGKITRASYSRDGQTRRVDYGENSVTTRAGLSDSLTTTYGYDGSSRLTTLTAAGPDKTPPVTACNVADGAAYVGDTAFALAAADAGGSGLAETRWQLDSGDWSTESSIPVSAPATGTATHTIRWYSTDHAGNSETQHAASFTLLATGAWAETRSLNVTGMPWLDGTADSAGPWATYSIYADDVLVGTKAANGASTWACPQTSVASGGHVDVVVDCGFSSCSGVYDSSRPVAFSVQLPLGSTQLDAATWTGFSDMGTVFGEWYDDYDDYYKSVWVNPTTLANITVSGTGADEADPLPPATPVVTEPGAQWFLSYDASGRLSKIDYPQGSGQPDRFETLVYAGSICTVSRPASVEGVSTTVSDTYVSNPDGSLAAHGISAASAAAREGTETLEYGAFGGIVVQRSAAGVSTRRAFDVRGNCVAETDGVGRTSTAVFNSLDLPEAVTDPKGALARYTYESATGLLLSLQRSLTTSASAQMSWTYLADGSGRLNSETRTLDATGAVAVTTCAEYGDFPEPGSVTRAGVRLSEGAAPLDLTTHTTFDAFGEVLTRTDETGLKVLDSDVDAWGRVDSQTDAAGATTHYGYDTLGRAVETSTTAGADWTGWGVRTIDPTGLVTQEKLLSAPTVAARTTDLAYDGSGQLLTESASDSGVTTTRYDAKGAVAKVWQPGAAITTAQATQVGTDADSNPTTVTAPAGSPSTARYAADGQLAAVDPVASAESTIGYDAAGQPDAVSVPLQSGGTTQTLVAYDLGGRRVASVDASGAVTVFGYDLADRCTWMSILGTTRTATAVYNSLGWLLSSTDADGATTRLTYDVRGQVTRRVVALAGRPDAVTQTTFDTLGRPSRVEQPDHGSIETTYNVFGQLVSRRPTNSAGSVTSDIAYGYDYLGRESTATDSVSGAVSATRTYATSTAGTNAATMAFRETTLTVTADAPGRELTRQLARSGSTITWVTNTRDDAQRGKTFTLQTPSGARGFSSGYDSAGRLISQTAPGLTACGSDYDPQTGKRDAELVMATGGYFVSWDYVYGPSGRLVTATPLTGTALTYDYDAAGQITKAGSTTLTYASGKLSRAVTAGVATDYTFFDDRRGTASTPTAKSSYGWNDADRLTAFTYDAGKNGSIEASGSYSYDVFGQRTRSVVTTAGVVTTATYTWDGTSLLGYVSTAGTSTTTLTYLRDEDDHPRALVIDGTGIASTLVCPLAMSTHGDVVAMTDAAGAKLATWAYDPYGNILASVVTTTALVPDMTLARRIAGLQVLRYAGYVFDAESGLYYCSARYYDPATCQWLTRDPLGADGQRSAYLYCGGDPVGASDPSGLITDDEAETWKASLASFHGERRLAVHKNRWIRKAASVSRAKGKARKAADAAAKAAKTTYVGQLADYITENQTVAVSEQAKADVAQARAEWCEYWSPRICGGAVLGGMAALAAGAVAGYLGFTTLAGWLSGGTAAGAGYVAADELSDGDEIETAGSRASRLLPDPTATGPHSTFKIDPLSRKITHYATWEPNLNRPSGFDLALKYDGVGGAHFNRMTQTYVPTPHLQGRSILGGVRLAEPWEVPAGGD